MPEQDFIKEIHFYLKNLTYMVAMILVKTKGAKTTTKSRPKTKDDQKRYRYIKSLLALKGDEVELQEIAREAKASPALVSQVLRGNRKGHARNGKKIAKIKKLLAEKLGKPEEELFPRKAA